MDYYNSFMNQMEKLFYHLDKEQITDEEVMEKLFALKEEESEKESQMNMEEIRRYWAKFDVLIYVFAHYR